MYLLQYWQKVHFILQGIVIYNKSHNRVYLLMIQDWWALSHVFTCGM